MSRRKAATVVHTMPSGRASLSVRIDCESGSYLEYLPDPQILFPRSRCRSKIAVRLGGDAVALVSDAFLSHDPDGQGEMFSAYASEIVIENATGRGSGHRSLEARWAGIPRCLSGNFRGLRRARNDDRRRSRSSLAGARRGAPGYRARSRGGRDRRIGAAEFCGACCQGARRRRRGSEAGDVSGMVRRAACA